MNLLRFFKENPKASEAPNPTRAQIESYKIGDKVNYMGRECTVIRACHPSDWDSEWMLSDEEFFLVVANVETSGRIQTITLYPKDMMLVS